jgi:protein-tyrosine phosphatase
MRQVTGYPVFLSNAYEARDLRAIHAAEIKAVIDLALNEPPLQVTRDLIYCRFPLIDGSGNPAWLIRAAVEMLAELLRANVPTLVYCSAGLSRTPVIVAAAIARLKQANLHDELLAVLQDAPADVSPALVAEVEAALRAK